MNGLGRLPRTTILGCGCLCFLLGLGLAYSGLPINGSWVILLLMLVLITRRNRLFILPCLLLGFTLGWWRGASFMTEVSRYLTLYGEKVILHATADSDGVYDNRSQLSFDATNLQLKDPEVLELPGKIKVSGFGAPAVYKGDELQIEGKLFATFGARQGRISFANLEVQQRNTVATESLRRKFAAGMQTALPEPLASFGVGLLVGQRATLPEETSKQLAAVGLTHLIAVSGYNLTILMRAARRVSAKRSKYQTTALSLLLMSTFLLITGFSASIVRASIVSLLSLIAWYYGRTIKPVLLILVAATITATWNPLYLWSDIGWYLSFLAFFGVLVLAPLLIRLIYRSAHRPKALTYIALESICAQLMTVPYVLWIFEETSLVAPISNFLVVPLVPLAMLFSAVAGLSGMLIPIVAGWLALPAWLILTYMIDISTALAQIPHAILNRSLSLWPMLALYGLVLGWSMLLRQRLRVNHGTITDEEPIF